MHKEGSLGHSPHTKEVTEVGEEETTCIVLQMYTSKTAKSLMQNLELYKAMTGSAHL